MTVTLRHMSTGPKKQSFQRPFATKAKLLVAGLMVFGLTKCGQVTTSSLEQPGPHPVEVPTSQDAGMSTRTSTPCIHNPITNEDICIGITELDAGERDVGTSTKSDAAIARDAGITQKPDAGVKQDSGSFHDTGSSDAEESDARDAASLTDASSPDTGQVVRGTYCEDNGHEVQTGETINGQQQAPNRTVSDQCVDPNTLDDASCNSSSGVSHTITTCQNGCQNGACQ